MIPAIDLFDNAVRVGSPEERVGFAIVFVEIAVDRGLQIDQRMEDTALQPSAGEGGKKALDRVGPGAGGRREVEAPARMACEPGADPGLRRGRLLGCLWAA